MHQASHHIPLYCKSHASSIHRILRPTSPRYGDGVQATKALWDPSLWSAWDVPPTAVRAGNNTVVVTMGAKGAASAEPVAVMKLELSLPVGS